MTGIERPDGSTAARDVAEPVRHCFDWAVVPPSEAICKAIGVATNRDPTELGPLYETLDLEAVDGLLPSAGGGVELTFTHDGLLVVVRGDGELVVEPVER